MGQMIPLWQAVLVAAITSVATIYAQVVKSKAESVDKSEAAELANHTEFNRQLLDAASKVPALLDKCEVLMKENATLTSGRAIMEAKLEAIDARVRLLEQEKLTLEQRIQVLLTLEQENIRLTKELEKARLRIAELEMGGCCE